MTGALPDPEQLGPHQLMGMSCALCGRYLGSRARELGTVRDARFGYAYRLWACLPHCRPSPAQHHAPRPAGPPGIFR